MEAGSGTATARPARLRPNASSAGRRWPGRSAHLFRLVGINRSARNPNLCNRCNTHVEEGRVVELTVLFADLSGFTAMTRQLGPERTHEVVDAFLKSATYALVRHGAFIDKYVGDAVMAFFNAPIRYEDHAARAVAVGPGDRGRDAGPRPSGSASTCVRRSGWRPAGRTSGGSDLARGRTTPRSATW